MYGRLCVHPQLDQLDSGENIADNDTPSVVRMAVRSVICVLNFVMTGMYQKVK